MLSRWVFKIDIETCEQCGGTVKVIACIEEPEVVKRILDHLQNRSETPDPSLIRSAHRP